MILTLLRDTAVRYGMLVAVTLRPPRGGIATATPRHYLVGGLALTGLPLLLAYHWLGLLLDELLFPGYRRVTVTAPVFILGAPRSGTTALHTALADDPALTTFRTWECLFALSITWRRLFRTLGRVDARLGAPIARGLSRLEARVLPRVAPGHPMGLHTPEEDYLSLLPVLWCFILVVPFPDAGWLWRFARGERGLSELEADRLLHHYHRCLQRHLYVHGPDRRLLSKNAAFAPLAPLLRRRYPDARFLVCLREPGEALASQLAVVDAPLRACHGGDRQRFHARLAECFVGYYEVLLDSFPATDHRAVIVPAPALRWRLAATVTSAYARLGLPVGPCKRHCNNAISALGAAGPGIRVSSPPWAAPWPGAWPTCDGASTSPPGQRPHPTRRPHGGERGRPPPTSAARRGGFGCGIPSQRGGHVLRRPGRTPCPAGRGGHGGQPGRGQRRHGGLVTGAPAR